ncbi:hypothetical protein [Hymenobacter algoricola]|uniref:Uncharacterized protein n=1 Tax=Hymenobacter algoricola TaxID=486267 RepID=A0ABP7MMF1_9BACT
MTTHDLLPASLRFAEESYAEAQTRYSGFGKDSFPRLEARFPGFISKLRFFHPQEYQSEDVWAVYEDASVQFGIQLDPDCEVIVLWNKNPENSIELGTWWDDASDIAIRYIEQVFLNGQPSASFVLPDLPS